MKTEAILFDQPRQVRLGRLDLPELGLGQVEVDIEHSGISTGTERLLWDGTMPSFPGMGYPLVPGYEAVGRVTRVANDVDMAIGQRVFVPGTRCWQGVHSLFGASAKRLHADHQKVVPVDEALGRDAVLFALAATAYHSVSGGGQQAPHAPPDLIVGHGVMGRLLARMTVAAGAEPPTVWEVDAERSKGAVGYHVMHPEDDPRRDYRHIYDVSGDAELLNSLIQRLHPGGEIVLAGFYKQDIRFAFAPAFMREMRMRLAAEWKRADLLAVKALVETGRLSIADLVTHQATPTQAHEAYELAFTDRSCLKMVIDWRTHA
ncbi:MAG: putative L-galactonate oxidoreductase [Pseudomonadota bacterium]|jgi:3-hydroxyethyl bacteriochlorophyllide a dehydrogenase